MEGYVVFGKFLLVLDVFGGEKSWINFVNLFYLGEIKYLELVFLVLFFVL